MNPARLVTFAMYFAIAYLVIKMFISSKRNGKNKMIIDAVRLINEKDMFFNRVDQLISTVNDPEFANKGRVLKLWGCAYHQDFSEFDSTLQELDIDSLIEDKKGVKSIDTNEDSFFYLYLAIPNVLHHVGRDDLRKTMHAKLQPYEEILENQLSKVLSDQLDKYYDSVDDRGQTFFEKLLEGDYEGYIYSRTMIGIYKNLANATLYKIYQDQAKFEQLEEMKPMLEQFAQTGVGKRWIQSLDISLDNTMEEPVEKEVVENKKSNSEENLSETMVLEKLTDSDIEKLDQKPSENLSETMVLEKLTDADLEEKDKK
ncbi:MAG: hypothetical protein HXL41_03015 [Solobacterium sp.]|uniref:hypothetical protein n=1 Tax=Solobacterium sp. TaxID=2060878 RepID=UPI001CB0767C|nr:hypothetical protein [Solobacterium sp.]MBF1077588.1 hypothetical protein [Solobacterium sp.]MBF1088826.1 hypothetical protein [Solobacterium sp.]